MPELPEVEIIKNNLSDYLVDKTFHSIEVFTNKLRYKIPHNLAESIKNQRVTDISRIAKYIIVDLVSWSRGSSFAELIFHRSCNTCPLKVDCFGRCQNKARCLKNGAVEKG